MRSARIITAVALATSLAACNADHDTPPPAEPPAQVDTERLSDMVRILASDEFEGRAPGSAGEDRTVAWLTGRFAELGLQPGGAEGAWTQDVPLVHTQVQSPATAVFRVGDDLLTLHEGEDMAVDTVRPAERIAIDAPVVFVGFGVHAPERDWDDFGDIDLRGKVALFLVNDPDFAAAPGEPAAGRFGNRRMTYYGRWTYKFEEAARRGASAALVIHETEAAGYGWNVPAASPGENYAIANGANGAEPVALQGWLHGDAATDLLAAAGHDLAALRERARRPDFTAFELEDVRFATELHVAVERFESSNVLALLPGSTRPDEVLMVAAHWDAFGVGAPDDEGRTVRPGANDDALGMAGVLEIARVLTAGPPLERSVVFAAWTAEESGLLGSKFYAEHPVYPLATTVANLTLDILQTAGPAQDVILVGEGQSGLEDDLAAAAAMQGRVVTPESLPENGLFYRADHFPLARAGVPVLLIMGIAGAADLVEGGREAGKRWIDEYVGNCYHQTCDAWDPDWDLRGAAQDVEAFRLIVEDLANSTRWPEWKPASEFRAVRQESTAARR